MAMRPSRRARLKPAHRWSRSRRRGAVVLARQVEGRGSGNCADPMAAPMHRVTSAPASGARRQTRMREGHADCRAGWRTQAQELVDGRRHDRLPTGLVRRQTPTRKTTLSGGPFLQCHQRVADQVGRRFVPALRMKMQFCSSSVSQLLAVDLALDEARQHVVSGSPGCAAARRRASRDRRGIRARRGCRGLLLGREPGSSAPRMASDQPRSGPRSLRHGEQIADDLDGDGGWRNLRSGRPPPCASMRSSRRSTRVTSPGSMALMARGMSAPMMSLRTRVCSGGSLKTRLVVWCS